MFSSIFDRFVDNSPVSVIARAAIERVLNPKQLNEWFDSTAKAQYTKELLFSVIFDIISQVVCGSRRSVNAAYQASKEQIGVSITSVYNKLNGIETETSAALVRYAAGQVIPVIEKLGGETLCALPGFRIKLLDGNCIEKSQHRIKELRSTASGPLPGKSLVVYDPQLRIPVDVFPCEDGHAQERSLLARVLQTVLSGDVWIADRNFCTVDFTCEIASSGAFIIREHRKYPLKPVGEEIFIGEVETGTVYEQPVSVIDQNGKEHSFRRCRIKLKKQTRDGDSEIRVISNLQQEVADAIKIAELYRTRWTIETTFQELSQHLNSEINSLGYPRAALFGFCVALVTYMVLSVIKAALGSIHGTDTIKNDVSGYYLADEISGTYRGMMISIPGIEWSIFARMTTNQFVETLKMLASKVKLSAFKKHPRGPKKPAVERIMNKKSPHVSTAKILANRKKK
jgi:hypothetical protein